MTRQYIQDLQKQLATDGSRIKIIPAANIGEIGKLGGFRLSESVAFRIWKT